MPQSRKPVLGKSYTRKAIRNFYGCGNSQSFVLAKQGKGIFALILKQSDNPDAPYVVLVGNSPNRKRNGDKLAHLTKPIDVFVKREPSTKGENVYLYEGRFIPKESFPSWEPGKFNLGKRTAAQLSLVVVMRRATEANEDLNFDEEVRKSAGNPEERRKRLAEAEKKPDKKPKTIQVTVTRFVRNPDVVAEALYLAKGMCGDCGSHAPFPKASDQTPYLEVHHKLPLAEGGYDTVANAIALCPNCHRKSHYG